MNLTPTDPPDASQTSAADAMPLSPEQLASFEKANRCVKKLRRAESAAMADGIITSLCALLSISCLGFGVVNAVIGVALAVVAVNSFRGVARLKRFDPSALRLLAINQIFFASAIVAYALYQSWLVAVGGSELVNEVMTQLGGGPDSADLMRAAGWDPNQFRHTVVNLAYGLYAALIVGTIVVQGLTALYYARRERQLRQYLVETPAWVVELQRKTAHR